MISLLHIKNIGIIEDITLNLENGFNVLTGETGAGKSLIIDSIEIISGGRFSKEMIRKGENSALIEISIYSPENENSIDGNIIVSRELSLNGRNICKINGRLVTVNELRMFMKGIVDIHGQYENQNIMDSISHIKYLDDFIGNKIFNYLTKYKELYLKYNNLKLELKNNYGDEKEKQRKLDLLQYQYNEIEEASLKSGEEEELELQSKQLANQDKINENLSIAENIINSNIIDGFETTIRALEKIENLNDEYKKKLEELKSISYDLEEIGRDVYNLKYDLDFDSCSREEIEKRLDLIRNLKRKYGNNINEILEYKLEVEKEIFELKNIDKKNDEIRKELKQVENQMKEYAHNLHEYRTKYSKILSEKINKELADLEMSNSKFLVEVKEIENDKFNENGRDRVEFLICTNTGDDFKPLVKIASGGEISRMMLAIKTVLTNIDKVETLIFDEIDTGISGIAAKSVSEKMKTISKNHQIFVVTHLAVIAASANNNLFAYKEVENNKTKTNIKKLENEELVNEIARISSGNTGKIALNNAKELIKLSKVA
ncbi:MAG: DNA repair protein RecN [Clostridia bacterium]|nr:DNA repair protein RecN [Clostridia bacterium]